MAAEHVCPNYTIALVIPYYLGQSRYLEPFQSPAAPWF